MERNQKGGRVEKHKATPTEATIYLPNCLLDLCPLCISVPYLKIRPFLSPPPTPEKSLCIAHKMRLTFILQRKIVSYQPRPRNLVFSQVKQVLRSMWLKIYMTHDQLFPNSVFFFNKNAVATPFQILFVLSSKTRLAPNVAVTLCAMRPAAPTFLFFSKKPAPHESCHIPRAHFPCVLSSQMRLGFTSHCGFTCDAANRSLIPQNFSKENAPRRRDSSPSLPLTIFICAQARKKANVDKGALYVKAMLGIWLSSVHKIRWSRRCYVMWLTIRQNACHSAPKGWDVKGGIPQNACWRRNAMKLSLACARWSVAAWKRKH